MSERDVMLRRLRSAGIRDQRVLAAMTAVPREAFVEPRDTELAYADRALPIGEGQTISQPLMVAQVVEALELQGGEDVLDVGTGSGYQAAVIAACGARVHGIERRPALALRAAQRLRDLGFDAHVHVGDGSLGRPEEAPFDAIAVAAAAPHLPVALARQLRPGGRLVVPLSGGGADAELTRVRSRGGLWRTENLGPCRFVPLIGRDGYAEPTGDDG